MNANLGMVGYPVGLEIRGPAGAVIEPPAVDPGPIKIETDGDPIILPAGEKWDASVMRVNTKRSVLLKNIRSNLRRQLPQLYPHEENPQHIALVGGGWSLDDTYEELRQLYFDGVKLVALNGSAKWLMARNLRPSMHVILDARPENAEFVREPIPHCKYFFASQCASALFEACADREVYLFHAIADEADVETKRLDEFYEKRWVKVPTAGTVGITSIMVMRYLGFRYQHLFGIDSCFSPKVAGKHHAYSQPLNDNDGAAIFRIAGREFECSAWQASQARNFMDMIQVNGEFIDLEIHGDGMLAHILKTGATMFDDVVESKGDRDVGSGIQVL